GGRSHEWPGGCHGLARRRRSAHSAALRQPGLPAAKRSPMLARPAGRREGEGALWQSLEGPSTRCVATRRDAREAVAPLLEEAHHQEQEHQEDGGGEGLESRTAPALGLLAIETQSLALATEVRCWAPADSVGGGTHGGNG